NRTQKNRSVETIAEIKLEFSPHIKLAPETKHAMYFEAGCRHSSIRQVISACRDVAPVEQDVLERDPVECCNAVRVRVYDHCFDQVSQIELSETQDQEIHVRHWNNTEIVVNADDEGEFSRIGLRCCFSKAVCRQHCVER